MRIFWRGLFPLAVISLLLFVLFGCVPSTTAFLKLECQPALIRAEQPYYDSLREYGLVKVDFKVKNTGDIVIDMCTLTFEAICKDGSVYRDTDTVVDLAPGDEVWDYTYISTSNKEASEVVLTKVELLNWDYGTREIPLNIATPVRIVIE